jgi:hypothetical protein
MSHVHDHENHAGRGPLAHDHESGGSPWSGASVAGEPAVMTAAVVTLGQPQEGVTRSSDGTVPPGLGLEDSRRWVAAWALHIQSRLTSMPDVSFHGTPGRQDVPGSDRVTVESGGTVLCRLVNVRNPGQPFGWGRLGAGPSSLAKSLLVAALGRLAACKACAGTGKVTWLADPGLSGAENPQPWQPHHDGLAATMPAEVNVTACDKCEADGLAVHPRVYRALVDSLVAGRWSQGHGWHVTRDELLNWVERQNLDPALAVSAAEAHGHGQAGPVR